MKQEELKCKAVWGDLRYKWQGTSGWLPGVTVCAYLLDIPYKNMRRNISRKSPLGKTTNFVMRVMSTATTSMTIT